MPPAASRSTNSTATPTAGSQPTNRPPRIQPVKIASVAAAKGSPTNRASGLGGAGAGHGQGHRQQPPDQPAAADIEPSVVWSPLPLGEG